VMGQEVLKACSAKFMPIKQYYFLEASSCLPTPSDDWSEFAPTATRYDGLVGVLGAGLHQKLRSLSYFLVGAGAIGCEMLKNLAMIGLATSGEGTVYVTDMDVIEKSNLSRQFLFRDSDIHSLKSEVAAREAKTMNTGFNVVAQANRVGQKSQNIYDDDFWDSMDGCITALDNVEARLYVDARCVYYQKPLFDSGTLGTKGNTQVVIPFASESYGSTRDPPEEGIPVCTLKHFPNKIAHTIQWARDAFEGYFTHAPQEVNNYLSDPNYLQSLSKKPNEQIPTLTTLNTCLVTNRPKTFADCVQWARVQFQVEFRNNICQLLESFPADSMDKSGKNPFWSGPKRAPSPVEFDASDPLHLTFITSAANLLANVYNIPEERDLTRITDVVSSVDAPAFVSKGKVKIATTEAEAKEEKEAKVVEDDHDVQVRELTQALPAPSSQKTRLTPAEFEKDDDTNFHIAFITATSNLRARNYQIKEASEHETKFIAGKIIPAIATTTALVAGLVCLELFKMVQNKPIEAFRNTYVNLAIPMFAMSEPNPCSATTSTIPKTGDYKWSLWDRLDVDTGDITLQELIDFFEEKYGMVLSMLSFGPSMLYFNFGMNKKTLKDRLAKPISQLVIEVGKTTLPEKDKYLIIEAILTDEDDEEIDLPYCRFRFR